MPSCLFTFVFPIFIKQEHRGHGFNDPDKLELKSHHSLNDTETVKFQSLNSLSEAQTMESRIVLVHEHLSLIQIKYALFPGKYSVQFDVIVWEKAAKIYMDTKSLIVKTFQENENYVWVAFSIQHCLKSNLRDLTEFLKHTLTFQVCSFMNKSKLGIAARNDISTVFCYSEEDFQEKPIFCQLFECETATPDNSIKINPSYAEYSFHLVPITDPTHRRIAFDIMEETKNNGYLPKAAGQALSFLNITADSSSKIKRPREPSMFKKDASKVDTFRNLEEFSQLIFKVSGESILVQINQCIRRSAWSDELKPLSALMTCTELFNRDLFKNLEYLSIVINKLTNVPTDQLHSHGFKKIYAKYTFPDNLQYSLEFPLKETVYFDFGKVFVIENMTFDKILSLQLKTFVVELHSVMEDEVNRGNTFFGDYDFDENISNVMHYTLMRKNKNPLHTLLPKDYIIATAEFNLSELLTTTHITECEMACKFPSDQECINSKHEELYGTNEYMLLRCKQPEDDIYTGFHKIDSLRNSMMLRITCKLCRHRPIMKKLKRGGLYNRLICILSDCGLIKKIFNWIIEANGGIKETPNVIDKFVIPKQNLTLKTNPKITGFFIDDDVNRIFYMEGLINGEINKIWNEIRSFDRVLIRTHFNSSLVCYERLYSVFNVHALTFPMDVLLANSLVYVEGLIPEPARKAIMKIDRMKKSTCVINMCQDEIFPTVQEFASFALEFCAPVKCVSKSSEETVTQNIFGNEMPTGLLILNSKRKEL